MRRRSRALGPREKPVGVAAIAEGVTIHVDAEGVSAAWGSARHVQRSSSRAGRQVVLEAGTNSATLLGSLAGVRAGVMQYWLPLDCALARGK
jgi:hypothetical protein